MGQLGKIRIEIKLSKQAARAAFSYWGTHGPRVPAHQDLRRKVRLARPARQALLLFPLPAQGAHRPNLAPLFRPPAAAARGPRSHSARHRRSRRRSRRRDHRHQTRRNAPLRPANRLQQRQTPRGDRLQQRRLRNHPYRAGRRNGARRRNLRPARGRKPAKYSSSRG